MRSVNELLSSKRVGRTICKMNQENQARSNFLPDHLPGRGGGAFGSGTRARTANAILYEIAAEAMSDPIMNVLEKLKDPGGGLTGLTMLG